MIWFKQTIGHACGSIGLLHSVINGKAKEYIEPGSTFAKVRERAIGLGMEERAQMLYDDKEFEVAHQSVARMGDTLPPDAEGGDRTGHFVSFVKGDDGHLWELEGSRVCHFFLLRAERFSPLSTFHLITCILPCASVCIPYSEMGKSDAADEKQKGPLDRGLLGPDEDVLSPKAIELGIGRVIKMEVESGGGDLRFSCIALSKASAAG